MKKTNKKGFTLVELVIVIAVIAILAGVLIGTFASVITRANQSKAVQEVKAAVDEAYVEYVADNHKAPESIKITFGTDGKFASVVFGEMTDAGNVGLVGTGYTLLNNVANQLVYFNWNTENGVSTYSIETTRKGDELKVETTINAYVEAQLAKVPSATHYVLNDAKTTIEFTMNESTTDTLITEPAELTYDGTTYTVTISGTTVTVVKQ